MEFLPISISMTYSVKINIVAALLLVVRQIAHILWYSLARRNTINRSPEAGIQQSTPLRSVSVGRDGTNLRLPTFFQHLTGRVLDTSHLSRRPSLGSGALAAFLARPRRAGVAT
jgi:hypothetical protein